MSTDPDPGGWRQIHEYLSCWLTGGTDFGSWKLWEEFVGERVLGSAVSGREQEKKQRELK